MDPIQISIVLLTVIVTMLAIIIAVLLALVIVVLAKLKQLTNEARIVTENIANATAWLSPATVFSAAVRAFRK